MSATSIETRERVQGRSSASDDSAGLLSRVFDESSALIRSEMHFARSEVQESVDDLKGGIVSLLVGAVLLVPGATLLIAGVVLLLAATTKLSLWSSAFIVGGLITIIGAIMFSIAKSKLSANNLAPTRTQNALTKDAQMVEEKLS